MRTLKPILMSPNMPDVTKRDPSRTFSAEHLLIFLVSDIQPIGGPGILQYPLVMVVIDRRIGKQVFFVTLEESLLTEAKSQMLCVFANDGRHINLGRFSSQDVEDDFVKRAKDIITEEFTVSNIKEIRAPHFDKKQSTMKFFSGNQTISTNSFSIVKAALILGVIILVAVASWIYFSPYHTCVRSYEDQKVGAKYCAKLLGGSR